MKNILPRRIDATCSCSCSCSCPIHIARSQRTNTNHAHKNPDSQDCMNGRDGLGSTSAVISATALTSYRSGGERGPWMQGPARPERNQLIESCMTIYVFPTWELTKQTHGCVETVLLFFLSYSLLLLLLRCSHRRIQHLVSRVAAGGSSPCDTGDWSWRHVQVYPFW